MHILQNSYIEFGMEIDHVHKLNSYDPLSLKMINMVTLQNFYAISQNVHIQGTFSSASYMTFCINADVFMGSTSSILGI